MCLCALSAPLMRWMLDTNSLRWPAVLTVALLKEIVVASDAKYNEIAYGSATKGLRNAKVTSGE